MSEAPGKEGGTEERTLNIVVKCKKIFLLKALKSYFLNQFFTITSFL